MGKILIIAGVILIVAGLVVSFADRVPFLGRLPGDISINRGGWKIFFPITTSILISLVLSLLLYLFQRLKN